MTLTKQCSLMGITVLSSLALAQAEVVKLDLSPAGTDHAVGLSPANEAHSVTGSTGSGNEVLGGIEYDSGLNTLKLSLAYGSFFGFADLTGPATAAHIHGPAPTNTAAGVVINLAPLHLLVDKSGIIAGSVTLTDPQEAELMAGRYYLNVHTAANPAGEIRGQLVPLVHQPPTVTCPAPPAPIECAGSAGTTVEITVNVADPNGDEVELVWWIDGVAYETNKVAASSTPTAVSFQGLFGLGTHKVMVKASDGVAEPVSCTTAVTIVDTTPPEVQRVLALPNVLWPANHKLVPVRLQVKATDLCGSVTSKIVSVTSNEPVNDKGDGNTSPDWQITGDLKLKLRAERSGKGSGRIYAMTVETADESGNKSTNTVTVTVPHDKGKAR